MIARPLLVAALSAALVAPAAAAPQWPAGFDDGLRSSFAGSPARPDAPYEQVMRYLMTSFVDRALPGGSKVDQPGAPSRHGAAADEMEGFTRLAPMVASWLAGGRPRTLTDLRGREVDLARWLADGIASGTDPSSPGYWGKIGDRGQGIVEAADVARASWTARDAVMPLLGDRGRAALGSWLADVASREVPDNNWHLYPVLITEVLGALGLPADRDAAQRHFERFMTFRIGDGWYSDGPDRGNVDWYNAWGIHYELWWLRRISPGYGGDVVAGDLRAFAETQPALVSRNGIPIMGRSVCYRMAAPSAAVAASLADEDGQQAVDPGLARHAMDAVWRYFVRNGAFSDGVATQGYCGTDLRVLDNYSGPSSCLWSLRPLVLAFLAGPNDRFWTAPARPLPVERGDYAMDLPAVGWRVVGTGRDGDVRLVRPGTDPAAAPELDALKPYSWWRRALSSALPWRPYRPDNHEAKYGLPIYSSLKPFCGCAGQEGGAPSPAATEKTRSALR